MLDAPGGGGGTPWESMTIDKMQSLVQNPNTTQQWELVAGWKKSAELISDHRSQVQNYLDNLSAAWPPDKSAAAEKYVDRLKALIANLDETYEASLNNHTAFSSATGAIYQAQVQMNKIFQEYKNNEQALTAFNTKQQQQQSSSTPTPSPSPSGAEPPVAPGRQEELRLQAVKLLSGMSSELAQAQVRIVKPTLYQQLRESGGKSEPGGEDPYPPPPIPPITPGFGDDGGTSTTSTRPNTTFPTSTVTPVGSHVTMPITSPVVTPTVTPQPGLVLGGANQPLIPPPTTHINPINPVLPGGGGGPFPTPGLLPPSTGILPGGGPSVAPTTPGVGRGIAPSREGLLRPNGSLPEGGMRTTSPGVIGGAPGGAIGQPGAGRAGMRRVNPVGGVIGGSEGAPGSRRGVGASGMSAAQQPSGMYGPGGGRRSGDREESDGSHWDPDNPWQTAEGVDPVVQPSEDQRIDPGPAIGLH